MTDSSLSKHPTPKYPVPEQHRPERPSPERAVPFFNYPQVFTDDEARFVDIFKDVGRRGAFIMQADLERFESNLAQYTGAQHAIGVANATDGLQIALMAGGLEPGAEVLFCSHTMIATASAIHFAGGVPVPVEAASDHLLDINAIEAAVTPATRAIVVTQLNGRTADMDALQGVADRHQLTLFEDAAQALGSKFKGKCAGTFGRAAAISFYPAKVLGCLGDGGAVLCNDDEVFKRAMRLRDHGRYDTPDVEMWGFNSRLDNLQAAFLDYSLSKYDAVVARRRDIARLYNECLGEMESLVLPPPPTANGGHFDVYQNYEIEAERRDGLRAFLAECHVGSLVQWGGTPVHKFHQLGFTQSLPFTERLFERMLMLPMNMSISDADVHYVCDCIKAFYG